MTAGLQTRAGSSSPIQRDRAGIDSIRRHLPGSGSAGQNLPVERKLSMRIQLRIIAGDTRVISGDEIPRFDKRGRRPETIGFSIAEVRTALAGIQERLITVRTRFAAFLEDQLLNGQFDHSESRIVVVAHVAVIAQQRDPIAVRRDDHRFRMEISDLRDRIAEAVHRSGRVGAGSVAAATTSAMSSKLRDTASGPYRRAAAITASLKAASMISASGTPCASRARITTLSSA